MLRTLLLEFIKARGDAQKALTRSFAAVHTSTLPVRLGPLHLEITQDPDRVHEVLVADWNSYPKTPLEHRVLEPAMEGGLILLDGQKWKEHRGVLAAAFTPSHVHNLPALVATAAGERFSGWPSSESFTLSWTDETRAIISRVMCSYFLNLSRFPDSADVSRRIERAGREFATVEASLEARVYNPFWRLFGRFPRWSRPHRAFQRITQLLREGSSTGNSPSGCPFHAVMSMLSESLPDHDERSQEIKTLYGAGATTMHLLAWCADLLARNPEKQAKLRSEVLQFSRAHPNVAEAQLSELEQLPYLTAVLYETLRLYPPAPFLLRHARENGRLHFVFIPLWCMHRNPAYWERPDEFLPERWITQHGHWKDTLADSYLPFGAGPRVCIGKRFALVEARVALIELMTRVQFAPVHDLAPKMKTWVLTRPAKPVLLSFKRIPR